MIYFIQSGSTGPVKIGYSNNPTERLHNMQTGNPERLRLLVAVDGTRELEASLHVYFVEHLISGEWYSLSPEEIIEIVSSIIKGDFAESQIERNEHLSDLAKLFRIPKKKLDFQEIKEIFGKRLKIFSAELAAKLDLSPKQLSLYLGEFHIRPRDVRIGERVAKGYHARDFAHIWDHLENPFIAKEAAKIAA